MESISTTSENTNPKIRQISVKPKTEKTAHPKPKFHLLNIREKWFICPLDNCAVNLDGIAEFGATDAQFVAFIRQFVRLRPEHVAQSWGTIARCELLNWIGEHGIPGRQPKFHASKRDAEISVSTPADNSDKFGNRAQTEISNSTADDDSTPDGAA
jgi:hypothetical protein